MNGRNFRELLENQWSRGNFVCVGLDSDTTKFSDEIIQRSRALLKEENVEGWKIQFAFNALIVQATRDLVCAYKPNSAFYEASGAGGMQALYCTVKYINEVAPDLPVILDAKRADIGSTNEGYAAMAFDYLGVDAITVHPYLGAEALQPILDRVDKGIFVLCRTSNPGAKEFQDMPVVTDWAPDGTMPFYQYLAFKVTKDWDQHGNCGVVVGATYPDELHKVRQTVGDMPILIPGIGFQQKDVPLEKQVEQTAHAGKDSRGAGMIINSSRGIIFASKGDDFAEAARRETKKLRDLINEFRWEEK